MDFLFHAAPPTDVLVIAFVAIQLAYLVCTSISVFFMTRPVDWVDVEEAAAIPERNLPRIILLYPVLHELEETMRTIGGPTYGGRPHWEHHFDALKRMLDRREPDYRD